MRAQCCVCFNLLDSLHIAACPCGHTFHEECLIRWIDMSSSCPSCRTPVNKDQIIKRLFFDIHENCSESDHVENMHNEINSLKVQLIEKERQRHARSKSRDRISIMFSDSEAARHWLLTKLNEEKKIKDAMQREFTVILKENEAFIQEMKAFKETLRKQQVSQEITTEMEDFQNDFHDTWNRYFGQGKPLLMQLASDMTVIKREYYQVKTVLQWLVTELKLSNSEVQKYKQELIVLKKGMEKTSESLKEMLPEKTILQKQVLELTHSNEDLKYKQEVEILKSWLQKTSESLNPIYCMETIK